MIFYLFFSFARKIFCCEMLFDNSCFYFLYQFFQQPGAKHPASTKPTPASHSFSPKKTFFPSILFPNSKSTTGCEAPGVNPTCWFLTNFSLHHVTKVPSHTHFSTAGCEAPGVNSTDSRLASAFSKKISRSFIHLIFQVNVNNRVRSTRRQPNRLIFKDLFSLYHVTIRLQF